MFQLNTRIFHYEPLAILYSLPYALLMWAYVLFRCYKLKWTCADLPCSMISFLASILVFTLHNTDVATQTTVTGMLIGISCLIAWCIVALWDPSERSRDVWEALKKKLKFHWSISGEDAGSNNIASDASIAAEKSARWMRVRSRSLAKKMRAIKVPCVNAV